MKKYTDFAVAARPGEPFTILQISDMQVIDAAQRRYPERLSAVEIEKWETNRAEENCYRHIRSLVEEVRPDLIIVTGDIVYGEFDDSGRALEDFLRFMGTLDTPWAPVYGNHDNESKRGVDWQCAQYAAARNCLFARGTVSGNSNYTVGIYDGDALVRVLYMMDTNACSGDDPALCHRLGLAEDQVQWMDDTAASIARECGHIVPGFLCLHIPTADVVQAFAEAGYQKADEMHLPGTFRIGVDIAPAHEGDSGCKDEVVHPGGCSPAIADHLHADGIDGEFAGHFHKVNTSVYWDGIRYTFAVKCGTYDYHAADQLGGSSITLSADRKTFTVEPLYREIV